MVRLYEKLLEYGVTMHVESIPDTRTLIFTFEKSGSINICRATMDELIKAPYNVESVLLMFVEEINRDVIEKTRIIQAFL